MSSEFAALRAARERAGRSVTEIARALRVRPEHVRALESGDLTVFGPEERGFGFLAAYARELELDAAGVVARARSGPTGDRRPTAPLATERARREAEGRAASPFGGAAAVVGPGATGTTDARGDRSDATGTTRGRVSASELSASIWGGEEARDAARPAPTDDADDLDEATGAGEPTGSGPSAGAETIRLPPPGSRTTESPTGTDASPSSRHPVEPVTQPDELRRERRSVLLRVGAIVAAALVAAVLVVALLPDDDGDPAAAPGASEAPSAPAEPSASAPAAAGGEPEPSEAPSPDGVNLSLTVEQRSWVRVEVDGQNVLETTLEAGESREFDGDAEITVRLGNAGGVSAVLNGEELGALGSSGEVKTVTFTPSGVTDA